MWWAQAADRWAAASTVAPVQTIALVHAFGSSSRAWEPQVRALEPRYRVLAPDLPGHGRADGPFTLERAVAAVRGSLGDDPAFLVGISGGAALALLVALADSARVRGLVLSGGFAHPPRVFGLQRALVRALPWRLYTAATASFYSGGRPEHAQTAREDLERCGKPAIVAMLHELADLDLRARLAEVAVPALVVCGARDRPNLPLSRELAAGIPGAELRVVPAANHLWNLQHPDRFTETVESFVARVVPGSP